MKEFVINDDVLEKYLNSKDDELCVCGSGKKFADCHKLNYNNDSKVNKFEIYAKYKKNKKVKKCYNEGPDCNNVYSFSHSIPKQSLENIAEDNHVLAFEMPNPKTSYEILETYSLNPTYIGVNEIGCYYGFCNKHDTQVFLKIEKDKIVPTQEQIILTRYRALTKELDIKSHVARSIPIMNEAIEQNTGSKKDKTLLSIYNAQFYRGVYRSLKDYYKEYEELLLAINGKNANKYRSYIYIFDNTFPIQCCTFMNPLISPSGKLIQNWDNFDIDSEFFSMYCFYKNNYTYCIITWKDKTVLDSFMQELYDFSKSNEANAIVQFIFTYAGIHAFNPTWWKKMSLIKKRRLTQLFLQDILDIQHQHNPFCDFRLSEYTASKLIEFIKL
jgi:SEC-C motif.